MSPRVDVLIVNYNTRERLRECLHSLTGQSDLRVVRVADNGSTDGSLAMLGDEFPDVDALSLPHNPGFGAAVNALVQRSDAPLFMVLNADARLEAGALTTLADHLDTQVEAAVVGPRLSHEDGSLQRSCFPDPDLAELLWQESGAHRFRRSGLATFDHRSGRSVPWVLGAAMAIRRTAFDQVGGFDPGFFLYYEEVDLCRRLRSRGWAVHFVPEARVVHHGGSSTGQHSERSQRSHYRSLTRFHDLHGTADPHGLRAAIAAIMVARWCRDAVLGALGGARAETARSDRRVWRAVLDDVRDNWNDVPASRTDGPTADSGSHRLDWLVLLPDAGEPSPRIAVCGPISDDDLATIADHLDASDVVRGLGDPPFDLVISLDDATPTDDVFDAVGDDGSVYISRTGRGRRGAQRLSRTAESHGISVVAQHWLLPDTASPRRHVPLDHRGALQWYLDRLFIPSGRLQRLQRHVIAALPGGASIAARTHSLVGVRRRTGPTPLSAAIELAGITDDSHGRALVFTSGHDVGSRTIVMPFEGGASEPNRVVKIAGRPAMNVATEREHATLQSLHSDLPPELSISVPEPLGFAMWRDRAVSTESVFAGPVLDVELRSAPDLDRRIAHLDEVTDWVTELHRRTGSICQLDVDVTTIWFAEPFDRYRREFDADPSVDHLFERALARLDELQGTAVPMVRRHVDLGPWNIICTERGLGVIDWETAGGRPSDGRGLPFCDLDYFVKYWLHIVGNAQDVDGEALLFGLLDLPDHVDKRAATATRSAIGRYCDRMTLDRRVLPPLAVHGWVEQALYGSERDDMLSRSPGQSGAAASVRALAARTDELFD